MEGPQPKTSEGLLSLFKERGMNVKDEDLEKIKHINYYRLKEFARPLAKTSKENGIIKISYSGLSFEDVLKRYYKDKNLRIHLMHAIEKIEISIKTILSHKMGLRYGAFGYLNANLWTHRKKYTSYQIEVKQYRLKKDLLESVKRNASSEFNLLGNKDKDGFPTIWLAVDVMTFGNVVVMLEMMNESLLREIAGVYNASSEEFLSWIKCLQFARNICAHNSNLIDIKLKTKPKYRKEWASCLYMINKNERYTPTNRLAIILCITIYFVKNINPKYKLNSIKNSVKSICNESDQLANLLGFKSYQAINDMVSINKFTV